MTTAESFSVLFRDPGMRPMEVTGIDETGVAEAMAKHAPNYADAFVSRGGSVVQVFEHELTSAAWYAWRPTGPLAHLATTTVRPERY
jgi:hypothetical protein